MAGAPHFFLPAALRRPAGRRLWQNAPVPLPIAALAAPLLAAGSVHYQMLLAGAPVGRVSLALEPRRGGWVLHYESELLVRRGPVVALMEARARAALGEAGEIESIEGRRTEGGAALASVEARVVGGELALRVWRAGGEAMEVKAPRALPSALAPLLLTPARPCAQVIEETTGRLGEACAESFGDEKTGSLLGEPFRARVRDGRIERLDFPEQGATFVRVEREPALAVPPDFFGAALDGAGDCRQSGSWMLRSRERLHLPDSANQKADLSEDGVLVQWQRAAPAAPGPLGEPAGDDELSKVAARAAGGSSDAWAAAAVLARAVSQRVEVKLPAVGEGSPERVWRTRRAGCRGHAGLFLALARRAGLGARLALGLVAQEGRFYWHAWVQVRVGERWYDVDPTEGEAPAKAPRILFAAGDAQVEEVAPRLLALARELRISPAP